MGQRIQKSLDEWSSVAKIRYFCANHVLQLLHCKEQGKGGKFVSGCQNIRTDTFQTHEMRAPHITIIGLSGLSYFLGLQQQGYR